MPTDQKLQPHLPEPEIRKRDDRALTDAIRNVPTPALILCGDEDDNCIEPSMFLKKHLPAAGLAFFPKSGHVLNLEEPALFNDMVERFVTLVEAGR